MERKEYYKHNLPHFQQPGQAYFVTWNLKDAVPKKALKLYSDQLEILKSQIGAADSNLPKIKDADRLRNFGAYHPGAANSNSLFLKNNELLNSPEILESDTHDSHNDKLKKEYYILRNKYIKAYNDLLDAERVPKINLMKQENLKVMLNTLKFWEGKRVKTFAFCVMPNHVHWVFLVLEKDDKGNPVYLQDLMYSVKRFSAVQINKLEKRTGALWQKESFDTTIRDEKHLYYSIEYTLNNPVNAEMVNDWKNWKGCWSLD